VAPATVALALNIGHHLDFLAAFRKSLWLAVAIGILLTALLGWIAARRGLAPVRDMARVARGISASRLENRLTLDSVPVELVELALGFNEMLARLEDSFRRLKDFSSDLAHELRTPDQQPDDADPGGPDAGAIARTSIAKCWLSNAEEYERLARMIGDMLFLAQADHGLVVPHREPVDLAQQVRDLFDFFDALAEEKGLQLTLTGSGRVSGDKLMLRRALANLISNAIRHTPAGGTIRVGIESSGEGMKLSVENSGEPIPLEQTSRIFDRFYRGDASRHGSGEGAGLGLAITRSIIRAHGGDISVRSGTQGVCFELRME
jgi:two-component system heavy metal sensor histidine kinase CusS